MSRASVTRSHEGGDIRAGRRRRDCVNSKVWRLPRLPREKQTNKQKKGVEQRGIQITCLMVALFFLQLYRKTHVKVGVVVRKVVQMRLKRFHAGRERWGTVGLSDGRAKKVV